MDAAGDIYIGGTSDSIGTLYDYIILKYSSAGNLLWTKRYNGTANDGDQAKAMTIDNSGNIYITGWSVGTGTNLDFATVKYTSNGIELWAARWDDPANQFEEANAIAVDKNYNVFVAGFSPGAGTGEDFTTVKYNSAGNQQWVSHFNGQGSSPDIGMFITLDGYNDSYVYGQSNSNAAFIKYNSDGILQSQTIYNPFPSTFTPSGICLDNLGNIYAGGTASSSNWSLWSIKKYKQPGFVPLGAEEETSPPSDFVLYQNYPNPFNPNTIISYQLPVTNYVSLKVYDILGREVAVLINEVKQAGEYEVEFNAKNLTSGIYIYQFTAGSFSNSKAMLLIK